MTNNHWPTTMAISYMFFAMIHFVFLFGLGAGALDLSTYLQDYLNHDEQLLDAESLLGIARDENEIAGNVYASKLTLGPSQNESKIEGANSSKIEWTALDALYEQTTPLGLDLALEASRSIGPDAESFEVFSKLSLSAKQSLNQNSFGSLTRLKKALGKSTVQQRSAEQKLQLAKSCQLGFGLFLDAYSSQAKDQILTAQFKTSQTASRYSESAYKRRLLQKIDILGARADAIDVKSRYQQQKAQVELSLTKLFESMSTIKDRAADIKISSPFPQLQKLSASINQRHPSIVAAEHSVASAQISLEKTQNESRSPVDLGLSYTQRTGDVTSYGGNYDQHDVKLSLNFEWPALDSNRSANKAIAEKKLERARYKLRGEVEKFKASLRASEIQIQNLEYQIAESEKKISIYKERSKEALAFLQSGRIEFSEYQRFRDQLLSEELKHVDLKSEHAKLTIQKSFNSGALDASCGGLI